MWMQNFFCFLTQESKEKVFTVFLGMDDFNNLLARSFEYFCWDFDEQKERSKPFLIGSLGYMK